MDSRGGGGDDGVGPVGVVQGGGVEGAGAGVGGVVGAEEEGEDGWVGLQG